jgi:hypothetical protein
MPLVRHSIARTTFDVAACLKTLPEGGQVGRVAVGDTPLRYPITGIPGLLRSRRERPSGCRTAEQRDVSWHPSRQSCGMSFPRSLPRVLGVNAGLGTCQGGRESHQALLAGPQG